MTAFHLPQEGNLTLLLGINEGNKGYLENKEQTKPKFGRSIRKEIIPEQK